MDTEFKCDKCIKHKKIGLLAYRYKSPQGERRVCSSCDIKIKEAANKRITLEMEMN